MNNSEEAHVWLDMISPEGGVKPVTAMHVLAPTSEVLLLLDATQIQDAVNVVVLNDDYFRVNNEIEIAYTAWMPDWRFDDMCLFVVHVNQVAPLAAYMQWSFGGLWKATGRLADKWAKLELVPADFLTGKV